MLFNISFFILLAAIIFFTGKKLSYYGEIIASLTGLSQAWVGLILMAGITSLPELVVGISSAAIVKSADLTIGNVLGSCSFNLVILSGLDIFSKRQPIFGKVTNSHVMAASLGMILYAIVGIGLYLPTDYSLGGWISLISIISMAMYMVSVRVLYRYQKTQKKAISEEKIPPDITLKKAILHYVLYSILLVIAAIFLPGIAENISFETGLEASFVGTFFLAGSTSRPEVSVSYSAFKRGNMDIALGNLLGSNIFNILMLAIQDIFYVKGPLLIYASDKNIISVFAIMIMTSIVIVGLTFQSKTKKFLMTWDTLFIAVVFVLNLILLNWLK